MKALTFLGTWLLVIFALAVHADEKPYYDYVVAQDGSGDFTTIQEAIASLPTKNNHRRYVVYIKAGVYEEKLRIARDYVTLLGEAGTKIQYEQAKKDWQKEKDYPGPAVINIQGDDVVLENLTIANLIPEVGPTAYVVYSTGTRTLLNNCQIKNNGSNSVNLMDYKNGMYYLKDCYLEGAVDFTRVIGRGYIDNCAFYEKEAIASVWHAGITAPDQKLVIKNSSFDGVQDFFLGRHHYDAQFFLVNCSFTERMADIGIYRKEYKDNPAKNRADIYGNRHYYVNCEKAGTAYDWYTDNLDDYDPALKPSDITPAWTFGGAWQPEATEAPRLVKAYRKGERVMLQFDQPVTVRGELKITTGPGASLTYDQGDGRDILSFQCDEPISPSDLKAFEITAGSVIASKAAIVAPKLARKF